MTHVATSSESDCATALRAFAELDLAAWNGLPSACPASVAQKVFALGEAMDGRGWLGSERQPASYQSLADRPLRLWERDGVVVLLDFEGPFDEIDVTRLPGAPSKKLSVEWGYGTLPDGEWLYPERGLVAIVLPLGKVAHLLGFSPDNGDRYAKTLRPQMGKRPRPRQGRR